MKNDSKASDKPAEKHLLEIAKIFTRLGFTSFGGPAAHIALMEEELVKKRKWVSKEEFMNIIGFTNLIPGPNSTKIAIHLGLKRGGGSWA